MSRKQPEGQGSLWGEADLEETVARPVRKNKHADHQPGTSWSRRMTVYSGRRCFTLLKKLAPVRFVQKALLTSDQWRSQVCWLSWKIQTTAENNHYFQLAPTMQKVELAELDEPETMWPTPTSQNAKHGAATDWEKENRPKHLHVMASLLPTPAAKPPGWKNIEVVDKNGEEPTSSNERWYDKKTGRLVQKGLEQVVARQKLFLPTPNTMDSLPVRNPEAFAEENRTRGGRKNRVALSNLREAIHSPVYEGLWPTPRATEPQATNKAEVAIGVIERGFSPNLSEAVALNNEGLWPTPRASKPGGFASPDHSPTLEQSVLGIDRGEDCTGLVGGQLNPAWVEILMGLPVGWTKIE